MIRGVSVSGRNGGGLEGCLEDMVIELYSYYLNSRNVYLIYKQSNSNNIITNNNSNNNNSTNIIPYENNFISSVIDST